MTPSERALWRYSVIAPLIHLSSGVSITEAARRIASELKTGPNGISVMVSSATVLRWYRAYQAGGVAGLERRVRKDRGRRRALDERTMETLLELAETHSDWTVRAIIKETERVLSRPVSEKAAYRLLAGRRKKRPKDAFPRRPVGVPQVLWIADTWHGPAVYGPRRKKRRSYLIAIMDDASRAVMAGRFVPRDDVGHLIPIVRSAILARGVPHRLLVDNGANYRSRVLKTACAHLGVHLVHATPYRPTAKARLERFFHTVSLQLVPQLPAFPTLDLLNEVWARFLADYHGSPHRTLSEMEGKPTSPLGYYLSHLPPDVRYVSEAPLDELLVIEETRRVLADGTIRLGGRVFEVDPGLAGLRVLVRFNPARPGKVTYRPLTEPDAPFRGAYPIE